jgi:hypothetical protein
LAALALLVVALFLLVIKIMIPIQHIEAESRRLYVSNINNSNITSNLLVLSRNSACVYRFEQSALLVRIWEVQGSIIGAKSSYSVDCSVTLPTLPGKMSQ